MNMSLSKRNEITAGIQSVLQEAHQPNARAILFGSRARGDARKDSDWDILILLDKERITRGDKESISYPIFELGWEIDEMIHPIMFTTKEWEAKSFTPFYKNVMKEGVALWAWTLKKGKPSLSLAWRKHNNTAYQNQQTQTNKPKQINFISH